MSTTTQVVGPGDQTGIYYIPIANLPFDVSWGPLKNWISATVEVDRVEVFRASTSGWVRLKGRANFDKALKLFNGGGIYRGRVVVADFTNGTDAVRIKQHVDPLLSGDYQTSPYQTAPPIQRESDIWGVSRRQNYLMGYGQENATPYAGPSVAAPYYSQQPSIATPTRMPPIYGTAGSGNYYNYASQASGPQVRGDAPMGQFGPVYPAQYHGGHQGGYQSGHQGEYQSEGAQFTATYRGQTQSQTYNDGYATSGDNRAQYRATEQRKLHISAFPQQARKEDVISWIYHKAGEIKIITLHIPQNKDSQYLRGHAFAVFANSVDANTVMGRVNKSRFWSERTVAKLCQEGVTDLEVAEELKQTKPVVPTGPNYSGRHRGERSRRSKQTASASSDKKRVSSEKKSTSSSKTNDKKPSPPKEEEPKYTGPVIADGSSRKREKR
ncbi:hypothetical protein EDB80DRAFT_878902 [Ilyonectria destructans]|nr:hypothetical protein EDB80DRAFT_878902 [Ilyonectria destructans]